MKTVRMGKKHTPLIIGNWKMNPASLDKALSLIVSLKKVVLKNGSSQVYIAPPSIFLSDVIKKAARTRLGISAQNVHHEEEGAHTGEISTSMLKSLGASMVIAGHSERRASGESNELVAQKTLRILKSGMTAVVCVGETKRDRDGDYFNTIEAQLRTVMSVVPSSALSRLVIAYEPVWAIGTGKHATAEDVQEMKLFIQKVIVDLLGRKAVPKIRILYGGSVNADNTKELLEIGQSDGFLVGGASLKAAEFASIIKLADIHARS